jgi:hypothetical protein
MANVIIKSDSRRKREQRILRDFGHNPRTANKETREQAEHVAEKSREALLRLEGNECR